MEYYGIRGKSLDWFRSYLENRTQYTEISETLSDVGYIKCGVPQGSVLGPLLFLLYINDITKTSNVLKFYLFADDTTLFYSDKSNPETERILNSELNKVTDWLAANKLSLNVGKSNFMHFANLKENNITIKINGTIIQEKTITKYLGTIIDNKLSWKQHTEYINTKLSRALGIIRKIKYVTPRDVLVQLYYALMNSYVSYSLLNWSSTNVSTMECIKLSIKKAVRTIMNKNKYEHSVPLFKELKILPLDLLIKHKQATFMWAVYNKFMPQIVSHNFVNNQRILSKNFILPFPRKESEKRCLTYSGVKLWNELPEQLKEHTVKSSFSRNLKKYLLEIL